MVKNYDFIRFPLKIFFVKTFFGTAETPEKTHAFDWMKMITSEGGRCN